MNVKGCVKALGRVIVRALRELILMLPAPGRATIASIVYRLIYNFMRALLMLPLIMPLLPVILLAPQYCHIPFLGGCRGVKCLRRILSKVVETLPAWIDPWILWWVALWLLLPLLLAGVA